MAVYLTGLPGGFLADKLLGARLAVLLGGIIIALGHFSMVANSLPSFYTGLILITLGTGLLKPNISTMVGDLYGQDDPRRDGGFSILYMGVSLGAALAPILCGYIAQGEGFRQVLSYLGINLKSWHYGFAAAGVGMTFGLIQFTVPRSRLAHIGVKPPQRKASDRPVRHLTRDEWKPIGVIFILFFVYMLYSAVYEQSGSSLNLFADRLTRTELFGWRFPSSWFQSVDSIYLLLLAPFFSMLWVRLGTRQPSIPAKFCLALLFQGLALLLMVPASMFASAGKVSPWWLLSVYFVDIIGWMCIGPIGASAVTKLAPPKLVGVMMGVWFLGIAFGSKIAGYLAGFFDDKDSHLLVKFFGSLGGAALIAAALLALSAPLISKLMGKVH
jgi:POT family proton-dependent oligopeptide transporter